MAMKHIGKQATIAIRQPSMGPTFGIKGGAAGGGYSQVIPMELLNLHLTGDFHAVTAAHNLLAAMIDNHLHQGNALDLDLHNITWRRVLDVNDRALRNIIVGLGGKADGVHPPDRLRHHRGQRGDGHPGARHFAEPICAPGWAASSSATPVPATPVTAEQLKGAGAMAVIMRDALKPNLLQTLENTPVLVHAGPFGNIAHGNSSILADLIGIHTGDYLVTEAGFGADMGAERFFNIKCRTSGLVPDAAVVVATVRALKAHSGKYQDRRRQAAAARAARREPRRRARRRRQPEQADRERQGPRRVAGRRHQRLPDRPSTASTRRSGRSPRPRRAGRRCAPTSPTAAAARPTWPRPSSRRATSRSDFQFLLPARRAR